MVNAIVDKQVQNGEELTIAHVRDFISQAKKKQKDFVNLGDRSWNEIQKRNDRGGLRGGGNIHHKKYTSRFPLWWSAWKIRQPIVLARLAVPILQDTQGDDPTGRTACILGERLSRGILKTFDPFPEFAASVDDFLVTNLGWGRPFYRVSECVEQEKVRLQVLQPPPQQPQLGPDGQPIPAPPQQPIFLTPDGMQVTEEILEDEKGPYILTGEYVTIDNEEIYWEAGLYSGLLVDPDATRWSKVRRLAFEYQYSYNDFIAVFGRSALDKLARGDIEQHKTGKPIFCYEYHDDYLKEVRWVAENAEDFMQPKSMPEPDYSLLTEVQPKDETEAYGGARQPDNYDHSDLYGLAGFFPCTAPLIINESTKEFYPICEYFQVADILDDIHMITGRMVLLTRAIRVRFLFDSSVKELQQLTAEATETAGIGVPDLERSLASGNGDIRNLVAYFPVDEMIQGLSNMYVAFDQRLKMFYEATGLSEIVRGSTGQGVQKTYGERQMEGKFALNRIEPYQRKVQEWMKQNYELMMEMALKLFSDETLDEYITPHTLDDEDKERYVEALELLKNNKRSRFRVEFETDSTIAVSEDWRRKQAVELANVLTKAMESTAQVAETQPELAETELKVLKHLIGEFSNGKLFVDEIQDSIEQVIEQVSARAQQEDPPDPAMLRLQLDQGKLELDREKFTAEARFRELKAQTDQLIEMEKMKRDDTIANIEVQLQQFKISVDAQNKQSEIAADAQEAQAKIDAQYQKISADVILAQEEIQVKRDELLVELRAVTDKKELAEFELMLDAKTSDFEQRLATAQHELEETKTMMSEYEKIATEQRLQAEHELQLQQTQLDSMNKVIDMAARQAEIQNATQLEIPEPVKPRRKRKQVVRDDQGDISEIIEEDIE